MLSPRYSADTKGYEGVRRGTCTDSGNTSLSGSVRTPLGGLGHVLQGPGEASSSASAWQATIRHLQIPALLFCPGRSDGVDHD